MKTTVTNCARCRGIHHELEFQEFTKNPIECDGQLLTHWAMCPNTNEPILLRIVVELADKEILE